MLKNISDKLQVFYHDKPVGTLVALENGLIGFSYDPSWLAHGFSISPFSLPLTSEFFVPQKKNFGGLFGVFADSLPDSWGSYITSAYLDKEGL
jgi:serine/threonine-protein kinase HipA